MKNGGTKGMSLKKNKVTFVNFAVALKRYCTKI